MSIALRTLQRLVFTGVVALTSMLPAYAQTWPGARPITIVVPFPAGGGTDLAVRLIQDALQ